jgi:hypothetical protein
MLSESFMTSFAARLDHFVRWFVNSSPEAMIELPRIGLQGDETTSRGNLRSGGKTRGEGPKS